MRVQRAPPRRPCYTAWTFGELPELMELRRGAQVLIGFPALIDRGHAVEVEVFDEPEVAATKHRAGLRRLVALQIREPLKYLEKNIPELTTMAAAYMSLGSLEELRDQIIEVALDRAFLADPLPTDERSFKARVEEGRARLNLIAQEVARLAATVLLDHAAAQRKLKDSKPPREVAEDIQAQLQRLVGKRFLAQTAWPALQHLPRYLKGVVLRLDKLRADPAATPPAGRTAPAGAALASPRGRNARRRTRTAGRIPLAAGGVAHQSLCPGIAHAAAGEREAAGEGLGATERLNPLGAWRCLTRSTGCK